MLVLLFAAQTSGTSSVLPFFRAVAACTARATSGSSISRRVPLALNTGGSARNYCIPGRSLVCGMSCGSLLCVAVSYILTLQ